MQLSNGLKVRKSERTMESLRTSLAAAAEMSDGWRAKSIDAKYARDESKHSLKGERSKGQTCERLGQRSVMAYLETVESGQCDR